MTEEELQAEIISMKEYLCDSCINRNRETKICDEIGINPAKLHGMNIYVGECHQYRVGEYNPIRKYYR